MREAQIAEPHSPGVKLFVALCIETAFRERARGRSELSAMISLAEMPLLSSDIAGRLDSDVIDQLIQASGESDKLLKRILRLRSNFSAPQVAYMLWTETYPENLQQFVRVYIYDWLYNLTVAFTPQRLIQVSNAWLLIEKDAT